MDLHTRILAQVVAAIHSDIEGFELRIKDDSKFMRTLNFFVRIFNQEFMSRYTTTISPVVYAPRDKLENNKAGMWRTLAHEWIHLREAQRLSGFVWGFRYLLPQSLAPLAFLSLLAIWWGPWWLLNLCWLILLAPLPAVFRAEEEFKAYTMSFAADYWYHGSVHEHTIEYTATNFYTGQYYFMRPFKKRVLARLHNEVAKIADGAYDNVFPYSEIKKIINEERK